jgi:hypothetical protein
MLVFTGADTDDKMEATLFCYKAYDIEDVRCIYFSVCNNICMMTCILYSFARDSLSKYHRLVTSMTEVYFVTVLVSFPLL